MSDQKPPPDWDEVQIREVIDHYDSQDEDDRAAEIEAAWEAELADRVTDIRSGHVDGKPADRVFDEMRELFPS